MVAPFGIKHVVPIMRRVFGSNGVTVIDYDFGRGVSAVPAILRVARIPGNLTCPRWFVRREKIFVRCCLKCCMRRAPPEVCLRTVALGSQSLKNLARTHI